MFRAWICRIVSVIFLTHILAPVPASAQAGEAPVRTEQLQHAVQAQVNAARQTPTPAQDADERARSQDPFRQTDLALQIVYNHQQGALHPSRGSYADRRKAALSNDITGVETKALPSSTRVVRPVQPQLERREITQAPAEDNAAQVPGEAQPGASFTTGAGFETTIFWQDNLSAYEKEVLQEMEDNIKNPDFSMEDLLEYVDPYDPGRYDPLVTTLAAQALSGWLDLLVSDMYSYYDETTGMAIYLEEFQQRALYRLAVLERTPVIRRELPDLQAIGSLRVLLWKLYEFEQILRVTRPDLQDYWARSVGSTQIELPTTKKWPQAAQVSTPANTHGPQASRPVTLQTRVFQKYQQEIKEMAAYLKKGDKNFAVGIQPAGVLVASAAGLAMLRDTSLLQARGFPSVEALFSVLDQQSDHKSDTSLVPGGSYLQPTAALFSYLFMGLQEYLPLLDMAAPKGQDLLAVLKKFTGNRYAVPTVVSAVEVAGFLIKQNPAAVSRADREAFAGALENIYCRSSVGIENDIYAKNGTKQNRLIPQTPLAGTDAQKAQVHFESFGVTDPRQHVEFMNALGKIHESFGVSRAKLKPLVPPADKLIYWTKGNLGTVERHTMAVPEGYFYRCEVKSENQKNPVLKAEQNAKIAGAIIVDILLWIAFDGAIRLVGTVTRPLMAGVRSMPRALKTAGQVGRRTHSVVKGLVAGGREVRGGVQLAGQVRQVNQSAGQIMALSKQVKTVRDNVTEINGRTLLGGPGVKVSKGQGEVLTPRAWNRSFDPANRHLWGLGAPRAPIDALVLRQGEKTVALDMKALGLEKGVYSMQDWNKLKRAAKAGGFEFAPLKGAELLAAREQNYLAMAAAGKLAKQNALTRAVTKPANYWKYAGEKEGWKKISQKEFVKAQEDLLARAEMGSKGALEDYYALLGVSPNASARELKQAWRTFAKKNHPDRLGLGNVPEEVYRREELYKRGAVAYETLQDPAKRVTYDKLLSRGLRGAESPEGFSLGVSVGQEPFTGANGIGISLDNVKEDLTARMADYLKQSGKYSSRGVQFARLNPFWQTVATNTAVVIPTLYGLDMLTHKGFQKVSAKQLAKEDRRLLAPFQTELEELEERSQALRAEMQQPEGASVYENVAGTEALISKSWGMPYFNFQGSFLGFGMLAGRQALSIPMRSKADRAFLVDNVRYQLASNETQQALEKRFFYEGQKALAQYRDASVEAFADYGPEVQAQVKDAWDAYIRHIAELGQQGELTSAQIDEQVKRLKNQLDAQLTEIEMVQNKQQLLKLHPTLSAQAKQQISLLYDECIAGVKEIVLDPNLGEEERTEEMQALVNSIMEEISYVLLVSMGTLIYGHYDESGMMPQAESDIYSGVY